jgi:Trypsin-like peptidase domain
MNQLEDLLQQCTVKLTISGRSWGTGFFVAPGLILTCAHVVDGAGEIPIQVMWNNQENWAQAVVLRSLPKPYDLALLKMDLPIDANPPCVYLSSEIQSRDPLYLFGYPDINFPNGCPVTFECEGLTGDDPPIIKFASGQVRPGMSGSPLLDQRTDAVCGIVQFTRDRSIDLGGGAIPTSVILAKFPELLELQKSFHQQDQRWNNLDRGRGSIDKTIHPTGVVLTAFQHRQLTARRDALLPEWEIRSKKVKWLRAALGDETGSAVKFQLEQQLLADEGKLTELAAEIEEIDQKLSQ